MRLSSSICNHSFRATGGTIHQENGGLQALMGHESMHTTRRYVRSGKKSLRSAVERINP